MDVRHRVSQGLDRLPFESSPQQRNSYVDYLNMLQRWNGVFNLTAIRDPMKMVSHHLMDSLAIVPLIDGRKVLDVGSGAGLPGIPLAIHFDDREFVLLDSNGKKTRFLTQVCIDLALSNVEVVQSRVEEYVGSFEQVVCRAFASLDSIAASCSHLLTENGSLLAMKAQQEAIEDAGSLVIEAMTELKVPLLNAQRWAIELVNRP
jgi:16S rRNA (guanine527-N7)-methyltransferase